MPLGITSNPAEAADSVFSPNDYFLGIAQQAIATGRNTRIALPGRGEVRLYPERQEYVANIADQAEFFGAPATRFQSSPLEDEVPANPRHIAELLWQAGFHASQGRLVKGTSKFDVVQFRRWPNLPQLPKTANAARICALLTRHPTTIMLAHRQLGIQKDEVYQIYSAAYCADLVSIVNQNPEALPPAEPAAEETEARGLIRSLFAKISGL